MSPLSTMILAALLGPLVALGEQDNREGYTTKAIVLGISGYLRETRWWVLGASSGDLKEPEGGEGWQWWWWC